MAERASLAERLGVAELAFCFGFPYADFADCGPALAVYADTQAKADAAADAFAAHVAARESRFRAGHVAGGRGRGGGEAPRGGRVRSRWCSPTRRTIPAAAATATRPGCSPNWCASRRDGRGALPDQRCRERRRVPGGGRGRRCRAVARRQVRWHAVRLHGAGAEADRRALHADRPDGRRQSGQSRPDAR